MPVTPATTESVAGPKIEIGFNENGALFLGVAVLLLGAVLWAATGPRTGASGCKAVSGAREARFTPGARHRARALVDFAHLFRFGGLAWPLPDVPHSLGFRRLDALPGPRPRLRNPGRRHACAGTVTTP